MAKISPVSIKYTIAAEFYAEGPLEKPDVIGALFGQTEGLLGSDLELRELQKEGKIGRIDVELSTEGGKTKGEINIPSALDKAETAIIAAAIETIDKIGPTDAKITIKEIEDVRGSKRDYIMERAKKLLSGIKNAGMETDEMQKEIHESSRISKLTEYGEERLPAGDLSGNEIIVAEGRADVVNLLKHGVKNVIGMNGTRLPAEIAKLGEEKEITLFVDGDRGGKLIAGNVCDNAKVAFIAIAPDGKEVEELSGKEILMALRKKVTPSEFFRKSDRNERYERHDREERPQRFERTERYERHDREERQEEKQPESESKKELTKEDKDKIKSLGSEISGKDVLILNDSLEVIDRSSVSKAGYSRARGAFILVTETANSSVINAAEYLRAKYVAAKAFSKINETNIGLISI
jgi:DNA primase